jgi:hypothetical protein
VSRPQINGFSLNSQNMLKVYAAYSAIIVQIFYAFVFLRCVFLLLAFDGVMITLAGSRLHLANLGHNFG